MSGWEWCVGLSTRKVLLQLQVATGRSEPTASEVCQACHLQGYPIDAFEAKQLAISDKLVLMGYHDTTISKHKVTSTWCRGHGGGGQVMLKHQLGMLDSFSLWDCMLHGYSSSYTGVVQMLTCIPATSSTLDGEDCAADVLHFTTLHHMS